MEITSKEKFHNKLTLNFVNNTKNYKFKIKKNINNMFFLKINKNINLLNQDLTAIYINMHIDPKVYTTKNNLNLLYKNTKLYENFKLPLNIINYKIDDDINFISDNLFNDLYSKLEILNIKNYIKYKNAHYKKHLNNLKLIVNDDETFIYDNLIDLSFLILDDPIENTFFDYENIINFDFFFNDIIDCFN